MPFLRTLLAFLFCSSALLADELRTLDNQTIAGTVVAVDAKAVSIQKSDGTVVSVALDNVIALDLRPVKGVLEGTPYSDIRLVDDSVLHCKSFATKGKDVEITLLTEQKLKVPLTYIVYILKDAHDGSVKSAWDKLQDNKVKRDRVVIKKNEQMNTIEGVLGDPSANGETIQFRFPGADKAIDLAFSKVQGLIFYRQEISSGNPICMVYDITGNALAARKVAVAGTKVQITTTLAGPAVEWEQTAIARFDYNMGKLGFLSDMAPSKVVEKSAVGLIVTHRRDVNLDGDPIVLGGQQYAKGLSLHAYTELEYDLKGKYRKFSAVVGVDTRIGSESEPTVTIEVDGRPMFSQTITAKTTVPLTLDITKANTLRIIVSSRNILDLHDHVTIAVPKVTQ